MDRSERLKDLLEKHLRCSSTIIMVKHVGQECRTFVDIADSVPTSHFPLILESIRRDLSMIRIRRKNRYNKGGRRG